MVSTFPHSITWVSASESKKSVFPPIDRVTSVSLVWILEVEFLFKFRS